MAVEDDAREWLVAMQGYVQAYDYEGCRELFSPEAEGFGTSVFVASGRDSLEREQWRQTWPNIRGFRFDLERLTVHRAGDLMTLQLPFDSRGLDADGSDHPRPGRATIVLRWAGERPVAFHTHFSLDPS